MSFITFKLYLRKIFQKFLYKFPFIAKLFRAVGSQILFYGNLEKDERNNRKYINLLQADKIDALKFDSGYGYEDEVHELNAAYKYYLQVKNKDFCNSESAILYSHIIQKAGEIFKDKSVKKFLNFGVSYAYIDSILASQFPDVSFIGVDRSEFTKQFNERLFNLSNLNFYAMDIFELLKMESFENGVFFHTRTLCLLPPSFLRELYKAVRKVKFKYVLGLEQTGISRQTLKPYEFDYNLKPSVLYRDFMFIHNYPAFLKSAGYDVLNMEFVKTDHPHKDMRMISLLASYCSLQSPSSEDERKE